MGIDQLLQHRLASLRLVGPPLDTVTDVVEWLVAAQAQDYAAAKWSLGLRLAHASDALVERAFNEGAILRTHLLRPTWHFVAPADIRWLLILTAPRVHALNAAFYRRFGINDETVRRLHRALVQALQGGNALTRDELRPVLEAAGLQVAGEQRMSYLLMRAELDGLIYSGPRRGRQFSYALLEEWVPPARPPSRDEALVELLRRYLRSRGPSTAHDFAKWSGLTLADTRAGLDALKAELHSEASGGQTYWCSSEPVVAPGAQPTAFLLSIFDEYISSYRRWDGLVDAEHAARLAAMGNDLTAIVVVDGRIVGTWKRTLKAREVVVRLSCFVELSEAQHEALGAAVKRFGAFLDLPVSTGEG
jgi:hypothetical protein